MPLLHTDNTLAGSFQAQGSRPEHETARVGSAVIHQIGYVTEHTQARIPHSTGLANTSRKRVPYQLLDMYEMDEGWHQRHQASIREEFDMPKRGTPLPYGFRYHNPANDGTVDDKHALHEQGYGRGPASYN